MAEQPNTPETGRAQTGRGSARQAESNGAGAQRFDAASDQSLRAAQDAAQANAEFLGRNFETAQRAWSIGAETTARTFERMAETVNQAFNLQETDGAAEQVTRNFNAASQAGVSLAISAQEASRQWLDLARESVRSNLEAFGEMTRCRSVQDVASVQTKLMRHNLELAVNTGRAIANASQRSFETVANNGGA